MHDTRSTLHLLMWMVGANSVGIALIIGILLGTSFAAPLKGRRTAAPEPQQLAIQLTTASLV